MAEVTRTEAYMSSLLPQHRKLIEESCIDPEVALERGYRSVETKCVLGELGFSSAQRRVPALLIPIRGVTGEVATYQCRPDDPRIERDGRPTKYETPKGSVMALDVPGRVRSMLGDPSVDLFITEGARKADAGASIGMCVIALLGVWNWRGTNGQGGKTALPDWEAVALNGRRVRIVFDSDVMTKGAVYSALLRLKGFLELRGAVVEVIYLPDGPGGAKVGLDDFLALGKGLADVLALSTSDLKAPPAARETEPGDGDYEVREGGLYWLKPTRDGVTPVRLANFVARIVREIVVDDGVEVQTHFQLEVRLEGQVMTTTVPVRTFATMNWPTELMGARAVVSAGMNIRDHLRVAILCLSPDVARHRVFSHTGWTHLAELGWVYLHAGGCIGPIGPIGPVTEVGVHLCDALAPATLPTPPEGEELGGCIRAALPLLDLGPAHIAFPLFSGAFRAAMGEVDFSLYLLGITDTFKTERAALIQSFFGLGFDARNLPASWTSTGNALEMVAFYAKDMVLVVDDFVPSGTKTDIQRQHRDAERIMRAQGNRSGRSRLTADATIRKGRAPRGMILSTGEDMPLHHSARARSLVLEVKRGDISKERLSACQAQREQGTYARVMAGFLQWVAPQYEEARAFLKARALALREQAQQGELHRRTAAIISELQAGFELFLSFIAEVGAVSQEEAELLGQRCWKGLRTAAEEQQQHQSNSEPARLFLRLLSSAISSGAAHLVATDGTVPTDPEAYGWRLTGGSDVPSPSYQCSGIRVGWVEGDDVYLDLDAALKAAQSMASEAERIPFSSRALSKRLHEQGYLKSTDEGRGHLGVRKMLEGRRAHALHLSSASLSQPAQSAQSAHQGGDGGLEAVDQEPAGPVQPDPRGPDGPIGPIGPVRNGEAPCGDARAPGEADPQPPDEDEGCVIIR